MRILPRPGLLARLGTGLVCAAAWLLAPHAQAAENVYTVANYPVEASAENAVAAKEKAMADGQQAAFRSLLKRLVPVTAFPHVKKLASVRAADLVEGVRVRKERNSRTDYIASFDFTFQAKSIRDLLRREGIPFVDEQAPPVTLVPVWRTASAQPLREDAAWTGVWKGLDLDNALSPIKLVALRGEVRPEMVAALANGDLGALRAFAAQYNTEYVLLAVGETDAGTGRLSVTLSGRDGVGGIVLRRQYRIDARDPAYTTELAAVVALRTLEGRWKAIKAKGSMGGVSGGGTPARGDTDLLIAVEFRGMTEWQEISRKLSAIPGVEELEVAGLSARGARVTLRFLEGAERLGDELAGRGLVLRNAGGNWVLSLR
jgi:hypothetical protein